MKRSTFLKLAIASAVAVPTLSACGGSKSSSSGGAAKAEDAEGPVRVWFMQDSISEEAQEYLKKTFAEKNSGKELTIEIQQWDGIQSKLQTALASDDECPDVVETGNTQSAAYLAVGAFADLSDKYESLGGDKLIPSFVKAGEYEGGKYALPLYAGARGVFYRKDLFKKAGLAEPKTIDDFHDTIIKLTKANPDKVKGFSGIYLAAADIHGVESYLFAAGGDYATESDGKWTAQVSSEASLAALKQIQDIFKNGTTFANDSQTGQKNFQQNFNNGQVGILIGTGNVGTKIDQKLWDADKVGVMALPSKTAGKVGATFAGGSNISVAAKAQHPNGAASVLDIIFSDEFQKLIAKNGFTPGNLDYAGEVSGAFGKISQDVIAASKLTPNTANWANFISDSTLKNFYTKIANGSDVAKEAKQFDDQLNKTLNQKES
ncbi:extracellular solute-binding protein [Cutibacterium sp.]|uniref:extracellular solute-binding protein n=1 Tax=Cutibacterium sp. TaxID=1912221 RepID=UPI0026DB6DFF|nr:extracellular solute-binding protein [Cutibacterium sp.]MDO4412744.1 extracellular solute-binding protein [Cutibacterium sp.]